LRSLDWKINDAAILELTVLPDILMHCANFSAWRPNYGDIMVAMLFRPTLYVIGLFITF
jgi:hypothetical protein